jgi:hypothetical protein
VSGTDVPSAATHDTRVGADVVVATTCAIDGVTGDTGTVTDDTAASADASCDLADKVGVLTEDVKRPEGRTSISKPDMVTV